MSTIDLSGKRIVLTQADAFMGPALARRLTDCGAELIADRADLITAEEVEGLITRSGRIDVLLVNLGIPAPSSRVTEVSDGEWQSVFRHMVDPLQRLVRAALPQMIERRSGKILLMGSASALRGMKRASSYSAARGAQLAYIRAVGVEVAPFNVQVNAIAQNFVENPTYFPPEVQALPAFPGTTAARGAIGSSGECRRGHRLCRLSVQRRGQLLRRSDIPGMWRVGRLMGNRGFWSGCTGRVQRLRSGAFAPEPPMTARQIIIARRFCGPPESGNGGYVAGLLAKAMPTDSQVTLHAPPPLDTPLDLTPAANGMQLRQDGKLLASVRPHQLTLDIPAPPSYGEAEAAETRFEGIVRHDLPGCFVCGTNRQPYDGLRIFTGPMTDRPGHVAAIWCPDTTLVNEHGDVASEFLWAALDCPGFFAVRSVSGPALLGVSAPAFCSRPDPASPCWYSAGPFAMTGASITQAPHSIAWTGAWWVMPKPPGSVLHQLPNPRNIEAAGTPRTIG